MSATSTATSATRQHHPRDARAAVKQIATGAVPAIHPRPVTAFLTQSHVHSPMR